MSSKNVLVIVESPTKAKTIRKFLPKNFTVEASMGHVRDLPQSASDVPAAVKKEEWARLGVNTKSNFEPLYIVPKDKSKIVSHLRKKVKEVDELYLATDEDREGESISWHLLELLKPKVPVKRMVFHEITKSAIEKALRDTRDIDEKLVRAQETRRILDRLVGFTLSPLIWKKIAFGLSAGRVQSVGLKVIVQRERERIKFRKAEYWDLLAELAKGSDSLGAKLYSLESVRIATGKDFDENTGEIAGDKSKVRLVTEAEAKKLRTELEKAKWKVISVEEKPFSSKPSPPFITSTLQQEANRKLGMTSREAMRTAQSLYENGLITYMRTDSPNLSSEAIKAARDAVLDLYGKEYLSPEPRQYSSKSKGAQEAHEAIRPAGSTFVHPKEAGLSGRDLALYEMIWKRTMATQMAESKKLSVSVRIEANKSVFAASGSRILFPGFLRAYVEGSDDPEAALEDKEVVLPDLKEGDELSLKKLDAQSHETKPPARFTEALLVQTLEKEGVGRPSTYASIIDTIVDRGYVKKVGNALIPTFTGFAVTQLLERNFAHLVDPGFTSKMEESLDDIAEGKVQWLPYLKGFYSGKTGLEQVVKDQEKNIDPETSRTIDILKIKGVQIKVGRFGAYIVKDGAKSKEDGVHASIPEDIAPADLKAEDIDDIIKIQERGPVPIGHHSKTGEPVYCLTGRFGPYVQMGEVTEAVPKPRRASLPKGVSPKTITMEQAETLLSLPRDLGVHPKSGKPILANVGRFGPYVMCDGDFRSLKKEDNVYTVDLARALEILSAEKKGRGGSTLVRELGQHPTDKKMVAIYDGRYGMYVKHASTNATLPKDKKPESLTLEEALALVEARAALGKPKRSRARK